MNPHFFTTVLTFLQNYLIADAVIPDLEDSHEVLPKSLKWTVDVDQKIIAEYLSLAEDEDWKDERFVKSKGILIQSKWSKAYERRLYKVTTKTQKTAAVLMDALWLEGGRADSYNSGFGKFVMLTYGGRDKLVAFQQSAATPGNLLSPRNFVSYIFRRDCVGTDLENNGLRVCDDGSPSLHLYSNTSNRFSYDSNDGAVDGVVGTSGFMVKALRKDPPVSEFTWVFNTEFNMPPFIPEAVLRRVVVGLLLKSTRELLDYVEHQDE